VLVVGGGLTGIETATELAESRPDLQIAIAARGDAGDWLGDKARAHLAVVTAPALLAAARAYLNEVGINHHHQALTEAARIVADGPDLVSNARATLLAAQEAERQATEELDEARTAAAWELSGQVRKEGNRIIVTEPDGSEREVTAAVRDEWLEHAANTHPAVAVARTRALEAEHQVGLARLEVDTAENRWQAARYQADLARTAADLAVAHLGTLTRTLSPKEQ
jgi:hypothetical protein